MLLAEIHFCHVNKETGENRHDAGDEQERRPAATGGQGGTVVTSDGPFAETKEVLTGFYLFECADLDEAVATAAKIPAAWSGAIEVRPVIPM